MHRCILSDTSKYAYKAQPKRCQHMATVKLVLPIEKVKTGTMIEIAWVCAGHGSVIQMAKLQTIEYLNAEDRKIAKAESDYNDAVKAHKAIQDHELNSRPRIISRQS